MLGRLTLNPLKHIDPFLTIVLPVLLIYMGGPPFGGAKPVPVNPRNYRNYRTGDLIVSLAGIFTNLVLFVLCAIGFVAVGLLGKAVGELAGTVPLLQRMMYIGMWVNTGLAFFNLIPIPPLDGSHVLKHMLPPGAGLRFRQLYMLGIFPILLVVWLLPGVIDAFMWPARTLMHAAIMVVGGFALPGSL
jgi:Zn-dependent protease